MPEAVIILLINPGDTAYRHKDGAFKRSVNSCALTLPTLAALVPAHLNATIRIVDEGVEPLTGLDDDSEEVFCRTADFIDEAKIDLVYYAVFTPFPGTPVFADLEREGRILTRDGFLYNTENVVFQPRQMRVEQLTEGLKTAWSRTYSLSSIVKRSGILRPDRVFSLVANFGFRFYAQQVLGVGR